MKSAIAVSREVWRRKRAAGPVLPVDATVTLVERSANSWKMMMKRWKLEVVNMLVTV